MNGYYTAPVLADDKLVCCLPASMPMAHHHHHSHHPHPQMHPALAIPYHFQQHAFTNAAVAPVAAGHFGSFYGAATGSSSAAAAAAVSSQFTPFSVGSSGSDSSSSDASSGSSVMVLPSAQQVVMIEGRPAVAATAESQLLQAFAPNPSPSVAPFMTAFAPRPVSSQPADWFVWNSLSSNAASAPGMSTTSIAAPVMPPVRQFDGLASLMRAAHQFPPAGFIPYQQPAASFGIPSENNFSRKRKTPHVQCTYSTSDYGKCPKKPAVGDIRTIRQTNRFSEGAFKTKGLLEEVAASDRGKELIAYVNTYVADRKEVMLTALVYFELSARRKPIRKGTSIRSLVKRMMICVILAGKWLDDDHVDNAEWSRRLSVSLKCVNRLERQMFDNLGYDLSVSQQELLVVLEQVGSSFGLLR
eukprot:TRINITY_DN3156_c0_g1_i1.p1 TRINITY_DN3156_c0_g1~~TRINITY_DN3156_c0_g1_i1.p1  ORF type:complete len:414 (-),score=111.57 TRINITY_DN3156_c0_g1_i1:132-1373(-)